MDEQVVNGYRLKQVIGEGQYGVVIHCTNSEGINFAVKKIPLFKLQGNRDLHGWLDQETRVLLRLTHPHIIEFIETFSHAGFLWTVYEFCNRGSLKSIMAKNGPIDETTALAIARSVLTALCCLAQNGLVHRDIKPENILIKEETVKLADFGFCIEQGQARHSLVGSPMFMAPEALQNYEYTHKGDIYALGVTLYIILTNKFPYCEKSFEELYIRKINYDVRNDQNIASPVAKELLAMMFSPAEWRPTAAEALGYLDSVCPLLSTARLTFGRSCIAVEQAPMASRRAFGENPLHSKFCLPQSQPTFNTKIVQLNDRPSRRENTRAGSQSRDRNSLYQNDTNRCKSTRISPIRQVPFQPTSQLQQPHLNPSNHNQQIYLPKNFSQNPLNKENNFPKQHYPSPPRCPPLSHQQFYQMK